jgi:hypothetical protein
LETLQMSKRIRLLATSLPLAICLCAVTTGYGQDSKGKDAASPPKTSPTAKETESDAANPIESLATQQADERDTKFELLVDLRLLGKAWADSNASLLADCALQFAQAERAMSRSHQSITADQLLETAARMAGMNRDNATLDRLSKVADKTDNGKLAEQVEEARKTAAEESSDDTSELTVSVTDLSPAGFARYQDTLKAIETARLNGNPESLDEVKDGVSKDTSLSDEQRKQLLKLVADSQESIKPNTGGVPKILDKLTGTSRQVAAAVGNAIFNTLLSRRQRAAISRAGRATGFAAITLPGGRRVIYAVTPGGVVVGAIPLAAYRLPLPVNFVNLRRSLPRVVFGPLGIPIINGVPFINLGGIFPNIFGRTPGARFVNFLGRRFPLLTGTRGLTFFNGPNGNRIIVQRGTAPATPPAINLTSRLWLENITVPSGTPRKRRAYLLTGSGTGSGNFQTWLEREDSLGSAIWRRRADGGGEQTGTFTFSSNALNLSRPDGTSLLSFTIGFVDAKTLRRGLNGNFVFWYGFGGTPAQRGQVAAYIR